jgi:hypothetical protein
MRGGYVLKYDDVQEINIDGIVSSARVQECKSHHRSRQRNNSYRSQRSDFLPPSDGPRSQNSHEGIKGEF